MVGDAGTLGRSRTSVRQWGGHEVARTVLDDEMAVGDAVIGLADLLQGSLQV